ncbi:1-phosphofructokinase family hexose kinase [Breznakiella homolactica]|uniref:Tagatose-6-phosphate kinase n=1 Tax=Breznakiella homolactica TaxID=2798577 RepID=A0A7T8B8G4_9SPIR|nr:PfkB family carbohydrate kinase [Breznakiella homolactica]QQO08569.1 tagatose-6-phosphate kinase [Breznakiella homolactica]
MASLSFLTVCLNPTFQKTLRFAACVKNSVNRTDRHRFDVSGKGVNVARVLTQLGRGAVHLTQLGGPLCSLFLSMCREEGLDIRWEESRSPIRFCCTVIDDTDATVTELVEESLPVHPETGKLIAGAFEKLLPLVKTVIISGTKAAGFDGELIPGMVRRAKAAGLRVILDIRGPDLTGSLRFRPDIIKPNLSEFLATFFPGIAPETIGGDGKSRIAEKMLELCADFGCRVVLTRGPGAVWAAEGNSFSEFEFEPLVPLNSTGSGDAFTAGLAAALEDGEDLSGAIQKGIECGRLNAAQLKPGSIL